MSSEHIPVCGVEGKPECEPDAPPAADSLATCDSIETRMEFCSQFVGDSGAVFHVPKELPRTGVGIDGALLLATVLVAIGSQLVRRGPQ